MKKCYNQCSCAQCKNKCEDYKYFKQVQQGAAQSGESLSEYLDTRY
jgi:hypothetical protein